MRHNRTFIIHCVLRQKIFLFLLYAEPFLNYLEMETSFESPRNSLCWQVVPTLNEGLVCKPRPQKLIQIHYKVFSV